MESLSLLHWPNTFVGPAGVDIFSRLDEDSQPETRFNEPGLSDTPKHMVHSIHFSQRPRVRSASGGSFYHAVLHVCIASSLFSLNYLIVNAITL